MLGGTRCRATLAHDLRKLCGQRTAREANVSATHGTFSFPYRNRWGQDSIVGHRSVHRPRRLQQAGGRHGGRGLVSLFIADPREIVGAVRRLSPSTTSRFWGGVEVVLTSSRDSLAADLSADRKIITATTAPHSRLRSAHRFVGSLGHATASRASCSIRGTTWSLSPS